MQVIFEPIGAVSNEVSEKKDHGWGQDCSSIIVNKEYQDGLQGLSDFSHIIVVYYLDKAQFEASRHLVRRPQGRADMPMVGIFSQRAKDRPNPIGITAVRLVDVKDNVIAVQGLDAINGTPVLDIKPYYPVYDCRSDATVPEWVDELMKEYF